MSTLVLSLNYVETSYEFLRSFYLPTLIITLLPLSLYQNNILSNQALNQSANCLLPQLKEV